MKKTLPALAIVPILLAAYGKENIIFEAEVIAGGFHHFDASIDIARIVDKILVCMGEGLKDAFHYIASLVDSLGMPATIASITNDVTLG